MSMRAAHVLGCFLGGYGLNDEMLNKDLWLAFIVLTKHTELNGGSFVLLTCFFGSLVIHNFLV